MKKKKSAHKFWGTKHDAEFAAESDLAAKVVEAKNDFMDCYREHCREQRALIISELLKASKVIEELAKDYPTDVMKYLTPYVNMNPLYALPYCRIAHFAGIAIDQDMENLINCSGVGVLRNIGELIAESYTESELALQAVDSTKQKKSLKKSAHKFWGTKHDAEFAAESDLAAKVVVAKNDFMDCYREHRLEQRALIIPELVKASKVIEELAKDYPTDVMKYLMPYVNMNPLYALPYCRIAHFAGIDIDQDMENLINCSGVGVLRNIGELIAESYTHDL